MHEKEKSIWRKMRYRCKNPSFIGYDKYGGKGISICKEWDNFDDFLKDMGKCPEDCNAILRIDDSKDFFKLNCRWGFVGEGRPKTRVVKKNKRKLMKNPYLITVRIEKDYVDFLKNQAIHKSLENKKVYTLSDIIKDALNKFCPAPKQIDMFDEE